MDEPDYIKSAEECWALFVGDQAYSAAGSAALIAIAIELRRIADYLDHKIDDVSLTNVD